MPPIHNFALYLGFLFTMSDPTVNSKTSLQILREPLNK
jgi:hypothetical protein